MFAKQPKTVKRTKRDVLKLIKSKGYQLLRKEENYDYWVKPYTPGNIGRNKSSRNYLAADNHDYSLVVLASAAGTEGLVSTKKSIGFVYGLYDGGGLFSLTELYNHIKNSRY